MQQRIRMIFWIPALSALIFLASCQGADVDYAPRPNSSVNSSTFVISPAAVTLVVNNLQVFTATGGNSPYSFSIFNGSGSVLSTTGSFTAPGVSGLSTVRVTDSLGAFSDAQVTTNAALQISPSSKSLTINSTQTFTAAGGLPPLSYSLASGSGIINSSSGGYTAPSSAGSAVVRVTDSLGNTADSAMTINAALVLSPATATISSIETQAYSLTGGVSPFTYSVFSGPGSINAATGIYTASTAGSVSIRVTDSVGNTSNASLTVRVALTVSPTTAYVVTGTDLILNPTGGIKPYSYAIVAGLGVIDAVNGIYTAPATSGTATVRTTDSSTPTPATADTAVTIYNALTLSPTSITLGTSGTQTFTATGGFGALTFTVYPGTGTINSTSNAYSAPTTAGTDLIHVSDGIGNLIQATVKVVSSLTITPSTLKLPVFSTITFSTVLGTSPYTYLLLSGTGTVVPTTGLYTAALSASKGVVRVTDTATNVSDALITHIEPVQIALGSYHTCVRYQEGSVKCFGLGLTGQLGQGAMMNLADTPSTLGGNLPFVDLGTGRTASLIAVGFTHTCALLDNATVKCWGQNTYGELGAGSATNLGSAPNQMGNNLSSVNLGTGRTATKIFAFGNESCAILDNAAVKCWGRNTYGQLGQGDTVNRGSAASQLGDSLLAINLGAGRTAVKLTGGANHVCALLDNSTVKCFGSSFYGQLGYENTLNVGDVVGSMGDSLLALNLGPGRTVLSIAGGHSHNCALLDNGNVKCWGRNQFGQLGAGDVANRGDVVGTMGDSLPALPFSDGFIPNQLIIGRDASCGLTATNTARCWGSAFYGASGGGQTTYNYGKVPGDLGDGLPFINH